MEERVRLYGCVCASVLDTPFFLYACNRHKHTPTHAHGPLCSSCVPSFLCLALHAQDLAEGLVKGGQGVGGTAEEGVVVGAPQDDSPLPSRRKP